jgi:hypothetical protein
MIEQRIFHGDITPDNLAQALLGEYDRGNLRAQKLGDGDRMVVQITTREGAESGGQTALTITLRQVKDGVSVQLGKQAWLGLAASLSHTALSAIRNPWSLLGRLDDLAQDIESMQLSEQVWEFIENTSRALGASFELSERLRRLVCGYCLTANPVGEPSCIACGAPLGELQPQTCSKCGFVVKRDESICPNCGKRL